MTTRTIYLNGRDLDTWFATHEPGDDDASWWGRSMDGGDVLHIGPEPLAVHMTGRPIRVVLCKRGPAGASEGDRLVADAQRLAAEGIGPLVLLELAESEGRFISKAVVFDGTRAGPADVRHFAIHADLHSRAHGLIHTGLLAERCVAVVGVGSGGSMIAVELAKAGVGKFVLIDPERLEVANVARHACGLGDVGRLKTFAVRDLIQGRNPAIAVETHEFDVLEDPQRLRRAVAGCDLLIGATDSDPSRALVNRVAVEQRVIALFGRVLTGAYSGDVLRVRPHVGPCLSCIFTAAVREAKPSEISGMRQVRERFPDYTDGAELEQAIQVGLASDIAPVVIFMVKLALTELLRGQAGALASLEDDFEADFYTWVNRREDLYRSFKPLGSGLPTILSWIPVAASRRADCAICGSGAFAGAEVAI